VHNLRIDLLALTALPDSLPGSGAGCPGRISSSSGSGTPPGNDRGEAHPGYRTLLGQDPVAVEKGMERLTGLA